MKNIGQLDPNGVLTVHDMAEKDNLKFYNDKKYWNSDLREEFLSETRTLWDTTHADKYGGRIFSTPGAAANRDFALAMAQIDKEMDEAVRKHGKIESYNSSHVQDFYARIKQNRDNIVSKA